MIKKMSAALPEPDILVVAPWLQGGGGQGALAGVMREIPKSRIRLVVLFTGNRATSSVEELASETIFFNASRTPWGILRAARRLSAEIDRVDAIYSLMRASHLVLGMLPAARLKGRRVATTFHQLPSHDRVGRLGRLEDIFVRRAVRSAGLVTAPSSRAIRELIELGFTTPGRATYEPNNITFSDRASSPPHEEIGDHVKLLMAGRLSVQKGIDSLPRLLDQIDVPIHLRIAGAGELEATVQQLTQASGIHRVEYLGHLDDIEAAIDWSDALLMPSRWELNPLVVWETWSRGRPVLASNIDVFVDLMSVGPLFTFANAEELSRLLTQKLVPLRARQEYWRTGRSAVAEFKNERRYIAEFLTIA